MDGLSRWLCSFYADKVKIRRNLKPGSAITCGERVLLCTIELTGSNSAFKDYHENKIIVVYERIKPATSQDCTVNIKTVNCRLLCVYFTARRAGTAVAKIDLGKWYLFEDKSDEKIQVVVLPSSPEHLIVSRVDHVATPLDGEYRAKIRTNSSWELFLDEESELIFHVEDKFENIIVQVKEPEFFYVTIDGRSYVDHLKWQIMNTGTVVAMFCPKKVGETKLIVKLVDTRSNSKYCFPVPINIMHTPFSSSLTLKLFQLYGNVPKRCTAGKDFVFEMKLYDIFGCPVRYDTTAICDVEVKLVAPRPTRRELSELASVEKIRFGNSTAVAVRVAFKRAGERELEVVVNSRSIKPSHKRISVQVLPSTPNALTNVRFRPQRSITGEVFLLDSSVVYCNQWTFLEASVIDAYNNVIQNCEEYDVSLELSDGRDIGIEYSTEGQFENVKFAALLKLTAIGSYDLLIKLSSKNNPSHEVYSLKEIQLRVVDAPFSLAESKFSCPHPLTAGEEAELEMQPFDVFGCPFPTNSTTNCNLDVEIVNSSFAQLNEPEEIVEFKIEKTESGARCFFSIVLTKTGRRCLKILDMGNDETKMLDIWVEADLENTHWKLLSHPGDSVFRRKSLEFSVGEFDRFDNEVLRDASTESIPYLVKLTGPNDSMQYTEKLVKTDNRNAVAIRYHFLKCGSYTVLLAQGDNSDPLATFSVSVQDPPVDPHCSFVEWLPKYEDILDEPVFQDDETFLCCLKLKDVIGYGFDGEISSRSVKVKYGETEVQDVKISSSTNEIGCYTVVVPLKNVLEDDRNPTFRFFVNGIKLEEAFCFPQYEKFQKYDETNCIERTSSLERCTSIYCYGVKSNEIFGNDHLNNIKRVCKLENDPLVYDLNEYNDNCEQGDNDNVDYYSDFDDYDDDDDDDNYRKTDYQKSVKESVIRKRDSRKVIVIKILEESSQVRECRNLLLHLLKATYYRNQAFQADMSRDHWKDMASKYYEKCKSHEKIDKSCPHFCSQIKEKYAKLMESYHNEACEEFFEFYNANRRQSEIDLHGLLVVDEHKLKAYERQLRSKPANRRKSDTDIKALIDKERDHGNEAIRKLRERLENYDMEIAKEEKEPWLEIIVGAGNHSKIRQRIRPKIEDYLKSRGLAFSPVNKGALVVTFQKYSGPEPCFGEYYCTSCGKIWKSSRSWVGQWQACYKCHKNKALLVECLPLKQRPKRKQLCHRPILKRRTEWIPHLPELCAKCIELGHECPQPLE